MELAYRLAAEEGAPFDQIRQNVIVMMSAAAEPDGRDRYVGLVLQIQDSRDR
jgi:hypothetical protein